MLEIITASCNNQTSFNAQLGLPRREAMSRFARVYSLKGAMNMMLR